MARLLHLKGNLGWSIFSDNKAILFDNEPGWLFNLAVWTAAMWALWCQAINSAAATCHPKKN